MEKFKILLVWTAPGFGILGGTFFSIWFIKPVGVKNLFSGALAVSAFATLTLGFIFSFGFSAVLTAVARLLQSAA